MKTSTAAYKKLTIVENYFGVQMVSISVLHLYCFNVNRITIIVEGNFLFLNYVIFIIHYKSKLAFIYCIREHNKF